MHPVKEVPAVGPAGAEEAAAGKLVGDLERLASRVEATAALVAQLRRRLHELEKENVLLLRERQDVSARLTALIEKVDLLSGDS
jgi:regulator of replication initiation timing